MQKAYDTILQSEVSAELVARNGGYVDPYRFECSCCGEEVRLAIPSFGSRISPHFRHRWGNNDTDCENYLGNNRTISIDSHSRISKRERLEFYYDHQSKTFSIGLRYSAEEIQSYKDNDVNIELRIRHSEKPFKTLRINTTNFASDSPTYIQLDQFSQSYCLSNTLNSNSTRDYHFMKSGSIPVFFKLLGGDANSKAKLVRTPILFTNTRYFVIFQNQYSVYRFHVDMQVGDRFTFETMGRSFAGFSLLIRKKTDEIDYLIKSWGYELEDNETLTLLWPPAAIVDDVCLVDSDTAFVYTSFELQAHGNINVHSSDIRNYSDGLSRVAITSITKINKSNAEMTIEKHGLYPKVAATSVFEGSANTYTIKNDGTYFLFNRSGIALLTCGQVVYLTPNSEVRRYNAGYLMARIYPRQFGKLTGDALLLDILKYYKRTESFDYTQFNSLKLSDVAKQYITTCKETGFINSVTRQYILEGQL